MNEQHAEQVSDRLHDHDWRSDNERPEPEKRGASCGSVPAAGRGDGHIEESLLGWATARSWLDEARGPSPELDELADEHELADLLVAHDVGVRVESRYEIKRVYSDYFGVEEGSTGTGA